MKITTPKRIVFLSILSIAQLNAAPKCSNTLEPFFSELPQWLSGGQQQFGLDMSCVKHSMNAFRSWAQTLGFDESGKKGLFIYCSEENFRKSSLPQCQTDSYMNVTLNTFNNVTDCLGINSEDLYPIVAAESGFYHNSISVSDADFGFGQVTNPAISDVNDQWYKLIGELKENPKSSCQNIISYIEENNIQPVEDDYKCTLTEAPKNPLLNALYSGLHFKTIAGYMDGYEKRNPLKARIEGLLGPNFSIERYEAVKSVLNVLSYNMGHFGATTAFEEFLLEKEYDLKNLKRERVEVSTKLAKINFQLFSKDDRSLSARKEQILIEMEEIDNKIRDIQRPQIFNGDDTINSFGEYIVQRKLSFYLKVLNRRIKYVAIKDKSKLCPTTKFLHVD